MDLFALGAIAPTTVEVKVHTQGGVLVAKRLSQQLLILYSIGVRYP